MSYEKARKDYVLHELLEHQCPENPVELLHKWLEEAHSDNDDANAMTLSSVNAAGQPSSRIVLLRQLSDEGLVFYTNYASSKGEEMATNPHVALNFFWPWVERQVRVQGLVEKLPAAVSDAYFASRPRESQIGAWASNQSKVLTDRVALDEAVKAIEAKYKGSEVPRPPHWGGYLVRAHQYEFWQGRASRLHDRIRYTKNDSNWSRARLSP